MAQYTGRISKLFSSRFGGSFGLEGQQGIYFNTKSALPSDVVEGVTVSFEGQMQRNGKSFSVTDSSLKVLSAPPPAAASGGGGGGSYADRDNSIKYQSSRKDALAMVAMLVTSGALDVSKVKQAEKAGVIEAAVDRFTAIYFDDIESLGALDRSPAPELPAAGAKTEVVE